MPTFKVLRGKHADENGVHLRGSIVTTKTDLLKFNSPGSIKFERVADGTPATTSIPPKEEETAIATLDPIHVPYTREELEDFDLAGLREIAEDLEVDVTGLRAKAKIIAKILGE